MENCFNIGVIPDYCEEHKLKKFYDYYLENLKRLPYKMVWMDFEDIPFVEVRDWYIVGDKYLKNTINNKIALGLDILENGTYWPIFIIHEKGKVKLREGMHRLYTIKLLKDKGLWDNRKILVMTDEIIPREYKEKIYFIPHYNIVNIEFLRRYKNVYKLLFKQGLKTDDREGEILRIRMKDGYLCQAMFSFLLRNAFYDYKEKYGKTFKPSPVINNYNAWVEWRGY